MKFHVEIAADLRYEVSEDELKEACDRLGKWGVFEINEVSSADIQRLLNEEVDQVNGFDRKNVVHDLAKVLMEMDVLDPYLLDPHEFIITEAWTVDETEDE